MKAYCKSFLIISICLLQCIAAFGQISTKEVPVSFGAQNLSAKSVIPAANKVMPALNMALIYQEDESDEANGLPPRFGYSHPVNYDLTNSGEWTTLANGDKIWRLNIECAGALSINLLYDKFWLPEGVKLFIYSQDKTKHIGAFTSTNNKGSKTVLRGFATGLIYSDKITMEYYVPSGVEQGTVSIAYVVQGYRYIHISGQDRSLGDSDNCHININCPEGQNWQNEKNSVALQILVNGTRWCSGSLVNTTANDNRPLFLTANHCLEGVDAINNPNAYFYSFYWNYEHPTCVNSSVEPAIKSTSGATVVANNSASDFALLRLTEDPQNRNDVNLYYIGWDRSGNAGTSGVGIHHPQGDVRKISTYNQIQNHSTQISWSDGTISPANTHWDATFHSGLIAGGSSGSPLLNNDHRIIGQLHGGPAASCANQSYVKRYGKFSVSWTGNGATDNRRKLQPWLDPLNTGATTLNGMVDIPPPPTISGTANICYGSSGTYTVTNPPTGYTWSSSSNLSKTSQSGNTATFTRYGSGSAWVAVNAGGVELKRFNLVGTGYVPDSFIGIPSVYYRLEYGNTWYAQANGTPDIDQYEWMVTSIAGNGWTPISGWSVTPCNSSSIPYMQNVYVSVPSSSQTLILRVRGHNACGWGDEWCPVPLNSSGTFSIAYPNPVSDVLNIEISAVADTLQPAQTSKQQTAATTLLDIKLYNQSGTLVRSLLATDTHIQLNVADLPAGIYYLHVGKKGKTPEIKTIIINR